MDGQREWFESNTLGLGIMQQNSIPMPCALLMDAKLPELYPVKTTRKMKLTITAPYLLQHVSPKLLKNLSIGD